MFQKVFEYAGPHKKGLYAATAIGLITAAALIPAKPVPSPAPSPASRHMINVIMIYNSFSNLIT